MAQAYQDVFATLAIRTRAAIIGGSIVLPSPSVVEGKIKIDLAGPLQNVSFMFTPDGRLVPSVVRKIHLTREELPFLKPGKLEELSVFDTPFGKVGVAICADAWYPDVIATLVRKGARILAVPAFLEDEGIWKQPWKGYNLGPAPRASILPWSAASPKAKPGVVMLYRVVHVKPASRRQASPSCMAGSSGWSGTESRWRTRLECR
jgi:predicted amidohydrolase